MRVLKYILFLMSFVWGACSDRREDSVAPQRSVEASIDVSCAVVTRAGANGDAPLSVAAAGEDGGTRTVLGDDWATTRWSGDDRIAVWARNASGEYALAGSVFSLMTYIQADEARFTADIAPMADDGYDYVALYPVPDKMSGTRVTYNLPSVQDGCYRAGLDIMASPVVRAGSLTSGETDLRMSLGHKLHALRIRIPSGRNYRGRPVTRLLVEFPTEVTGEITFDAADPAAAVELSNGSRTVDVRLTGPLGDAAQEREAWIFVAPGEIAGGTISFTAVYDDGYCAETLSTQTLNRTLAPGHVTPVTLSASAAEQPLSWLDFNIDHSKLGEPVETLTVTAPEGVLFAGGSSTAAVSASSGRYSVGYYAVLYRTMLEGSSIEVGYDSANAVLAGRATLPAALPAARNEVKISAPYLLEEHFSGASAYNNAFDQGTGNPNGVSLADAGLPGWTGARVKVLAGSGVQVSVRHETVAMYPGRLDTPCLPLKAGRTVKLRVLFRASCDNKYVYCNCGKTTGTGPRKGDEGVTDGQKITPALNSYGDYAFSLSGFSSDDRVSWVVERTYDFRGNGWISRTWSATFDDVRVSIEQ